jgi:hypothetical protein
MLRSSLGRLAIAGLVAGAAVTAEGGAAWAGAAGPDGGGWVRGGTAISHTAMSHAASTGSASPDAASSGAVSSGTAAKAVVRPFTGTGCHTYDFWSGAHVCITVYGSGLHVNSVSGETDGPDSDWGELWDSDGVVNIYGHPTNHYLTVDWSSGGGIWLPQNDNFCFTDTTINQTACLTVHS